VASLQRIVLRYVAGVRPLVEGGQVRLLVPRLWSVPHTLNTDMRSEAPGSTYIRKKPEDVELAIAVEPPALILDNWRAVDIVLTILSGGLATGEQVEVQYGGLLSKVVVPRLAGKVFAFDVLVDPDGTRSGPHFGYHFVATEVVVETRPDRPVQMEAFAPSVVRGNNELSAILLVKKDRYHNCISTERRAISHPGCRVVAAQDGRVQRIKVWDQETEAVCLSNPIAQRGPDSPRLFWGDLHAHTSVSVASAEALSPEGAMSYARHAMGLDFVALTDTVNEISREEWTALLEVVRGSTTTGEFVAFPGFEFYGSESPGARLPRLDKNVIFGNADFAQLPPGVGRDDFRTQSSADLLAGIDPLAALVIPHQHQGGDWHVQNREKMRLVEMYSHWGCYECPGCERSFCLGTYPRGSFVSEALASGMRLGFVGSSDDHTGLPGNDFFTWFTDYPGGLTAVWAPILSPECAP